MSLPLICSRKRSSLTNYFWNYYFFDCSLGKKPIANYFFGDPLDSYRLSWMLCYSRTSLSSFRGSVQSLFNWDRFSFSTVGELALLPKALKKDLTDFLDFTVIPAQASKLESQAYKKNSFQSIFWKAVKGCSLQTLTPWLLRCLSQQYDVSN
jgi:hypothetical protein